MNAARPCYTYTMFKRFEWMLAFRYLRAKRKEGFISVIAGFSFVGIMLGVATLIVVMAVMDGFRKELLDRILGINAHISVLAYDNPIDNYPELLKRIRNIEGVTSAQPVVQAQVLVTHQGEHTGAMLRGMNLQDLASKPLIAENIIAGDINALETDFAVIAGQSLARSLRALPGDVIQLISPDGNQTILGRMPRLKDVRLDALFNVGMFEYDSGTLFMNLASAQKYMKLGNGVNVLEIMTQNPDEAPLIQQEIQKMVGYHYNVVDWKAANSHFIDSLAVERNVMFLILSLIITVAAFNIISGLIMLVKDKSEDIAILRTMGASRHSILWIFMVTGSLIGMVGTAFGVGLGLAFALNIEHIRTFLQDITGIPLFHEEVYFLSQLPAIVDWNDVGMVVSMSLLLSFLATLYPAWRAARMSPVEGLRYG